MGVISRLNLYSLNFFTMTYGYYNYSNSYSYSNSYRYGNRYRYNSNKPRIVSNGGGSYACLKVAENSRFVTDVQTYDTISSESNGRLKYYISGGVDKDLFEIDQRTGKVYFKEAPDFENPLDWGKNNRYQVEIKVVDGAGYSDKQLLDIKIEDDTQEQSIIRGDDQDNSLIGTDGRDFIFGEAGIDFADGVGGDDDLFGGAGNDVLIGGDGNDFLNGTDPTARGVGEVDNLTGSAGRDIFALGDAQGAYYLGNGFGDFAIINDFSTLDDNVVLAGGATDYTVANGSNGNAFILKDGDAIAQFLGQSAENINLNNFEFV